MRPSDCCIADQMSRPTAARDKYVAVVHEETSVDNINRHHLVLIRSEAAGQDCAGLQNASLTGLSRSVLTNRRGPLFNPGGESAQWCYAEVRRQFIHSFAHAGESREHRQIRLTTPPGDDPVDAVDPVVKEVRYAPLFLRLWHGEGDGGKV